MTGLVSNFAHPGGNVTGMSNGIAQTAIKHVELIRELVPGVSQVGVVGNPDNVGTLTQFSSVEAAGQAVGIRVQRIAVAQPGEFDGVFQGAANARLPALIITGSAVASSAAQQLTDLAVKFHLPTVGGTRGTAAVTYGADIRDTQMRAASLVDRILKGAKPGDLPVQEPAKFDLIINLKLARAIGITVPPSLLARATQVIE